jgi:hypothetical protein
LSAERNIPEKVLMPSIRITKDIGIKKLKRKKMVRKLRPAE